MDVGKWDQVTRSPVIGGFTHVHLANGKNDFLWVLEWLKDGLFIYSPPIEESIKYGDVVSIKEMDWSSPFPYTCKYFGVRMDWYFPILVSFLESESPIPAFIPKSFNTCRDLYHEPT